MARHIAALSAANALASAAALFITYRLAFQHLGAEVLGLWALLSAILAFARISDSGVSTAMLRQVALAQQTESKPNYSAHILAGFTVATMPTTLLAVLLAIITTAVALEDPRLSHLPSSDVHLAIMASLVFAVANSAAGVVSGCLDGAGKLQARVAVSITANAVQVLIATLSIAKFGFLGFAVAQSAPPIILLVSALVILSRGTLSGIRYVDFRQAVASCFAFTSGSLLLGIARTGFEPATKFLIGYYGDLPAVAMFDLANRVAAQLRQVITAALQPFAISAVRGDTHMPDALSREFWRWTLGSLLIGLGAGACQVISAPAVSLLVIGHHSSQFLVFSAILGCALFVNSAGNASFFAMTSAGRLRFLQMLHFSMLAVNVALGYALAKEIGGIGAVLAWGLVFAAGGAAVLAQQVRFTRPPSGRVLRGLLMTLCAGLPLFPLLFLATDALSGAAIELLGSILG